MPPDQETGASGIVLKRSIAGEMDKNRQDMPCGILAPRPCQTDAASVFRMVLSVSLALIFVAS
jgi:hypothetical protein